MPTRRWCGGHHRLETEGGEAQRPGRAGAGRAVARLISRGCAATSANSPTLMRARQIAAVGQQSRSARASSPRPRRYGARLVLRELNGARFCDRIDDCAADIQAVCAIPDLTAQRTRMIVDMLGDLQHSLHAIRATLGSGAGDQFGDLPASPAANANSPAAAKPATVETKMFKAKVIEAKVVGADIAAFTADLVAKQHLLVAPTPTTQHRPARRHQPHRCRRLWRPSDAATIDRRPLIRGRHRRASRIC
jgi:hypothetical protein